MTTLAPSEVLYQSLFGDMLSGDCGPWRRRIKSVGKQTDSRESISYFRHASFPEVTISSYTEAGRVESSVTVPNQRGYTVLEECITKNYDFGTAYGCLCWILHSNNNWGNIQDTLCRWEEEDQKMQQDALVGNQIVDPSLQPRHVWDLYSNRVVPWWSGRCITLHKESVYDRGMISWNTEDRVDVQTPINGYEWPATIPKDADLNLIHIEMLNLGVEYTWLDVLCLRQ
ncbi:hypothetical protein ARMGADRAFT_1041027, partial [Armillaria gallica]